MSLLDELVKVPVSDRLEVTQAMHRQFFVDSLYHTGKYLLGYKDVNWRTHAGPIHSLQNSRPRKLIVMPRGTFKTSLAVVAYSIWLLNRNPNETILLDSELYANSKNSLREIKEHMESERLVKIFGNYKKEPWNEGEITIKQRTQIRKEASITCSGVGAQKTGQHYDCLHAETEVYTSNGYVRAIDIRPGLRVLTGSGKFESVVATSRKLTSKRLVTIQAAYQAKPVRVTEDHRILVWRDESMQWIEAGSIRIDDKLVVPKISGSTRAISRTDPHINDLLTNEEVWRLIGYWLGDGCATKEGSQIRISFGKSKTEAVEDCLNIVRTYLKVRVSARLTKSNTIIICFSHSAMKEILHKFGTHSYNKHLPPLALNAFRVHQLQLLRGYFACDGSSTENARSMSSVSHNLLTGFQLILASLDIPCGIARSRKAGPLRILNYTSVCREAFNLTSTHPRMKMALGESVSLERRPSRSFFTENYWVIPIRKIDRADFEGEVFDIQVANTPSFYCAGMIAHNCIIADDMNSPKNSGSPEALQKVIDHYRMYTSILNPGGTIVIVGTRYSAGDLIGWILENEVKDLPSGLLIG